MWDIHGRKTRQKFSTRDFDKFIFLWDYFDSRTKSIEDQIENFYDILDFKEENPGKVIMLTGNHDYHYLPYVSETYSWFKAETKMHMQHLLEELISNWELIATYKYQDYIFSHAGISQRRLDIHNITYSEINMKLLEDHTIFWYNPVDRSSTGNHPSQSPIWIRPQALKWVAIKGTHVIGHTTFDIPIEDDNLIYLDAPKANKALLITENGHMFID